MSKNAKAEMLETLRSLVRDALRLRHEGAVYARLARAGGAVDGYMRALLDSGAVTQRELLDLIAGERLAMDGPASGAMRQELDSIVAA